jgi:hypothetical protein
MLVIVCNYCSCKAEMLHHSTRWFKYDQDNLCVNKSEFVPVILEPPCIFYTVFSNSSFKRVFFAVILFYLEKGFTAVVLELIRVKKSSRILIISSETA